MLVYNTLKYVGYIGIRMYIEIHTYVGLRMYKTHQTVVVIIRPVSYTHLDVYKRQIN